MDAGFGNELHLRGEGGGLSWDYGAPMENRAADEWIWQTDVPFAKLEFKILLNDTRWCVGPNYELKAGETQVIEPEF